MNKLEEKEAWNRCRKKSLSFEIGFVIVAFIITIIGILFDVLVQKSVFSFPVENFNGYILSILGIQSTISTLSIALIALISGNVSEIYMGVSVSNYYLNIRPKIFKYKIVVCISFSLLAISCILYALSLYNCLIAILAITIVLILLSAYEIHFLFRGLQKTKQEVKMYVWFCAETKKEVRDSVMLSFINDWASKIGEQTQSEYESYKETFIHIFNISLNDNDQETLSFLSGVCVEQVSYCLRDNNVYIKARGIELLSDIYDNLWSFVIGKSFEFGHTKYFNLLGRIVDELRDALKDMPISMAKRIFRWEHFTDTVIRTAFHIVTDSKELGTSEDIQGALHLSYSMGYILKYKEMNNREHIQDTLNSWGYDLNRIYLDSAYNIPEGRENIFLNYKCRNSFNYFKGFIDNEYVDIIKENVFFRSLSNSMYRLKETEITYYLLIDCYLYYLAEKESENCVEKSLKKAAKDLLLDNRVLGLNKYFFSKISMLDSDYYNLENTILYITDIMRQCERYPKYDGGKKLIVEEVVREFFVFMQLMSSDDLKIFGDTFIYINQFIGETENRTKKYLSNFYRVFSNMEDESIDSEVDKKYDFLKNKLQELYKKEEIEKAEDDQKKYLDTVDENDVVQCIRKKLKEHFEEVLGSLNVKRKKSNKKWTAEIELTNCNLFTDMIDKNIAETLEKEIFREIDAVLINGIIVELLEKQKISRVSRQDLKTDEEFIDFLKNNEYKILMGSEYVFGHYNYKNHDTFSELFKNSDCMFLGFYQSGGAALKKNYLKINIKKVDVTIASPSLNEIEYRHNSEKDILSYKVNNVIELPFEKEELIQYVNNKRKIITISAKLEFIAEDGEIGAHILRD